MDSLRAKRKPSLWVANIKTKLACAVSMGDQTNPRNRKACHWTCNSVSVGNEDSVHDHLLLMFSVGFFFVPNVSITQNRFSRSNFFGFFFFGFCYWLLLSWCGVCFGGCIFAGCFCCWPLLHLSQSTAACNSAILYKVSPGSCPSCQFVCKK